MICGLTSKIWGSPLGCGLACLPGSFAPEPIEEMRNTHLDTLENLHMWSTKDHRYFMMNLHDHLGILGDDVFCSWSWVGSPQPVGCNVYQWSCCGGVERSHDVTVDQIVHLLRTSFSAISNFLSFFRLSLDFLQAFFRLSLDFLQTFFRLSSDFLSPFSGLFCPGRPSWLRQVLSVVRMMWDSSASYRSLVTAASSHMILVKSFTQA